MTKGVNGKGKEVEKNMVEAYKKGRRKEEEKMIKRVVSIALTSVVFAALFGLIAPIQARCIPFTIYGPPPLADVIRENAGLRTAVREGLVKPLVRVTRRFVG